VTECTKSGHFAVSKFKKNRACGEVHPQSRKCSVRLQNSVWNLKEKRAFHCRLLDIFRGTFFGCKQT